jgi:transposase, IS30 family
MSQSAIGTLVDRCSRLVRLIHLPHGHRADQLLEAIEPVLASLPTTARLTLTWDQGSEMARHHDVAVHFAEGVFFAPPATPWLRGTNENTNGLLRQYFPKGTNLRLHTPEDLRAAETRLNTRPRKILSWRTPLEVFTAAMPG